VIAGEPPDIRDAMRIGILASHEGTTMQAVLDAVAAGTIPGQVAIVVSNNGDSGALRRARAAGVPTAHLSSATHPDPAELDRAIRAAITGARADLVLLAGYMKKLGPGVLHEYRGRILNTHPALLPKFGGKGMYGMRVHEAVVAAGEPETGVSIHLVDAEYDTGPVVAQCRLPVVPGDSPAALSARVQARERDFLVETLARIARGDASVCGRLHPSLQRT
jgi:phosphoribosylglycinamide formyltransferase 1